MLTKPKTARQYYYLGNVLLEQGKFNKAYEAYNKAIDLKFTEAKVYSNLGIVQKNLGDLAGAEKSYKLAIEINPELVDAYNNLGNILNSTRRYDEAILVFQKALKINPYYKEALNNLGTVWHHLGFTKKAITYYKKAIEVGNNYPDAYNNLGVALYNLGHLKKAIKILEKAILLRPNFAESYFNMASVYHDMGRPEDAIKFADNALSIFPNYQDALHLSLQQNEVLCNWAEAEKLMPHLNKMTSDAIARNYKPGEIPLFSISNFDDPQRNYQVARLWSEHNKNLLPKITPFVFGKKKNKYPLRIGYISSDFRDNVISHQFSEVFKFHNKSKFKIFAYSGGANDRSVYRKFVEKNSIFRDISQMGFVDAANLIYRDKIDILVDLNGFTRGAKLEVSALRPAPIVAHYLGFPGTMGSDVYDYIICDKVITPKDVAKYYSEKFVYLPDCYQAQSYNRFEKSRTSSLLKKKASSSFIFCSFNNNYKITKQMFSLWMRILKAVPGSVLWLGREFDTTQKNLILEAKKFGINTDRLIFTQRLPLEKHLERLTLADIALDTYPYNGGATTSNALWAGVPVVTLQGRTYLSRMSSSLLTAIEAPELITDSFTDYEELAINLANNPIKLKRLKLKLLKNRDTKPLFNTKVFVGNLEKAYSVMWDNYSKGHAPELIDLND